MFHNETPDLQDQYQFFGLKLVLSYKTDGLRQHHWLLELVERNIDVCSGGVQLTLLQFIWQRQPHPF